jgi:hypothetical protein
MPGQGSRALACTAANRAFAGPYFHVVFTLPQQTGRLALQNAKPIYNLLFHAASRALLETAADPRLLGASIGFLAVLHTWGQNLHLHPHLHCVVPGGGISHDGSRWIACRKSSFFLTRARAQQLLSEDLLAIPPVGIPERHAPLPW